MIRRPATLLALSLLCSCGRPAPMEEAAEPVAEVTTALAAPASFAQTVTAYGVVEPAAGAEHGLSAPEEADVLAVLIGAGSRVTAGQPLVRLAPSAQTRLELAKALTDSRTSAEAYARARRLRSSGLDSDADVETARAAAATAEATIGLIRARTARLLVRAPVTGVVETLTVAPGDLVAAGASLGRVSRLQPTRVRLGVEPALAARLRPGLRVRIGRLQGGGDLEGLVASIDPRADAQTRLSSVIVAPGAGSALVAGETVRGDIVLRDVAGVAAPRGAILYDQDRPYVMAVENGAARRRPVELGPEQRDAEGARILVIAGLKSGERIIVDGAAALENGSAVKDLGALKVGAPKAGAR